MDGIPRFFRGGSVPSPLRIIITRHGERVDFTLGKDWINKVRTGQSDPRIPPLTSRPDFDDWKYDSPLTVNGENQSAYVGRKLASLGIKIDYCYSSPAYRSVQTANKILESQGRRNVPINIEPGLFECPAWYAGQPLTFIPPAYLAQDKKFNVNPKYAPVYDSINPYEDEKNYYRRSRRLIRQIIQDHKATGGTILLSGHGGSIEAVSRGLRSPIHRYGRSPEELIQATLHVSYANFAVLEQDARTGRWIVRLPEAGESPYGLLSQQTRIPLYGIDTEHLTVPAIVPANERRPVRHRQQRHYPRNYRR